LLLGYALSCEVEYLDIFFEKPANSGHFGGQFSPMSSNILFYIGADLAEGKKDDAISRLDRLFKIKREASLTPGVANTGTVGYQKSVTLRIQGSKYEFSREDGQKIVVDIEKKSRP